MKYLVAALLTLFSGIASAQVLSSGVGLTNNELRASPVPISGTFWQATQPVSIASMPSTPVTGTFWQATQPVSGTFFQATQPISAAALPLPTGASTEATLLLIKAKTDNLDVALSTRAVTGLTDAQLRAVAVPVSGTFFQATQPVSIAASVAVTGTFFQATQPVSGPLTDTQLRASAVPVSGPLTDTQLRASAVPVSGTFFQATQPVSGTVTITPPTLTKGSQGATGLSTQDLKDAGRQSVTLTWELMAGTANTESALANFTTGQRGGTALGAANNYAVSSGKTLRIQTVIATLLENGTTVIGKFRIRQAASVANNSPVIFNAVMGVPAGTAAAKQGNTVTYDIPDGLEVAAAQQITFTWSTDVNTSTASMTIIGFEY